MNSIFHGDLNFAHFEKKNSGLHRDLVLPAQGLFPSGFKCKFVSQMTQTIYQDMDFVYTY
jgi:hypothetical protein